MRAILFGVFCLLIQAQAAAGPVGGPKGNSFEQLPGGAFKQEFVGGERACVLVLTDSDVDTAVTIKVEDTAGNLVTQGMGRRLTAVIWYPPRTATYHVTVTTQQRAGGYIAFK